MKHPQELPVTDTVKDGDQIERLVIKESVVYCLIIRGNSQYLAVAPITLKQLIGIEVSQ